MDPCSFDVVQSKLPYAGRKCSPTGRLFHLQELRGREGGRISVQYLQWPFPLTGQGPMGTDWRRQTMNNRVQGWAAVPAQHAPLRDVDCRKSGGSRMGSRSLSKPHLGTCASLFTLLCLQWFWPTFGVCRRKLIFLEIKKAPTQTKKLSWQRQDLYYIKKKKVQQDIENSWHAFYLFYYLFLHWTATFLFSSIFQLFSRTFCCKIVAIKNTCLLQL